MAANPYDYYLNEENPELEVRKDADVDPLEQMVWHGYFIDAVAVRYYDSNPEGSGIEEETFTHDDNFNVTAVTGNTGTVLERYKYDFYPKQPGYPFQGAAK